MDVRWNFITNNSQSSRERTYNTRQLREQVNPKGLPISASYYLKSFRATMRQCTKKEQLVELYIKVTIIV